MKSTTFYQLGIAIFLLALCFSPLMSYGQDTDGDLILNCNDDDSDNDGITNANEGFSNERFKGPDFETGDAMSVHPGFNGSQSGLAFDTSPGTQNGQVFYRDVERAFINGNPGPPRIQFFRDSEVPGGATYANGEVELILDQELVTNDPNLLVENVYFDIRDIDAASFTFNVQLWLADGVTQVTNMADLVFLRTSPDGMLSLPTDFGGGVFEMTMSNGSNNYQGCRIKI